jgi:YD repeat-containing protein
MEQNKTFNVVSGIATIKLGCDELHVAKNTFEGDDYGLGTGGSDICVLSTEGLPLYSSAGFSPADPMKNYQSSSLRPRVGYSSDITQSDFAPFAVYWPGANYLYAWSYLNVFSQDYLDECADRITHLRASGLKDDSTQVQLESMNLMISSYKYQWYGVSQLAAGLSKYSSLSLHESAAAFYWPESGIGIDAQNEYEASYFSRGEDFIKSGLGWIYSALEHGVIQQSQGGSSNRAMSTAKYLAKSNTTQPIYVFGAELKDPALGVGANVNTVPPSSPAVPAAADVAKFKSGANNQYFDNIIQTYVANGVAGPISYNSWDASATLTIPWKNGSAVDGFNAWYVFAGDPYYGYWIGGHSGGLSGLLSRLNPLGVIGKFFSGLLQGLSGVSSPSSNSGSVNNPNAPNAKGNDPIDMRTGAYIYETTDLAVNAQPPLAFTRFYSSALSLDRSKGLGYGWSHNHIKRLALRSGLGGQFGETGRPEDAATMITSILVLKDMLECIAVDTEASTGAVVSERPARRFWNRTRSIIAASGIATWAVDELLDGDAVLTLGDKDYRFTRIPKEDGDYTKNVFFRSPVGMPEWKLSSNATGVFSMQRRYAGKMTFSALNAASGGYRLCTRDEDAYRNALVYAYRTSDGFLSTVTSDPAPSNGTLGPNLTFSYFAATTTPVATAARLSSVKASTDQATLFLTYQDSTNYGKYLLQKARPPVCANAANHYFYNYDSQQRLTKTTDPQGRVVMENFYGGDDRVYRQLSEGLATQEWLYEWEPGISREINPKGHATEFRYDDRSRLVGVKDNEGKLTSLVLDDEDRVIEVKGPDGQTLTRR